jgi:D-3-phosphoglycerate dehydrogenase/C-terminal binding protein
MYQVLVVDGPSSSYLEGLDVEREVLAKEAIVELCRVEDEEQIDRRLERAELIISWHSIPLSARSFARMENCRGVVRAAVGYDNIDTDAAHSRGIPVANVPDYGTEEVADHAIGMLLALVRNFAATDHASRHAGWDWRAIGPVRRLRGMRLGLVGFGRIGMAVAARARAFGIHVAFYDPFVPTGIEKALGVRRTETLHELLGSCAAISLHTPSSPQTRHMIGRKELAALSENAILINTARGDVVDQSALIGHLAAHPDFRAGLDVLTNEPVVPPELRASTQVMLSAHSAFYADDSLLEMRRKSAETAARLYRREPLRTIVNAGDRSTSGSGACHWR